MRRPRSLARVLARVAAAGACGAWLAYSSAARADAPFQLKLPGPKDQASDRPVSGDPWGTRPRAIMLSGGMGGPLGFGGVSFEIAPLPWLVLGGGAGYGPGGARVAAMPRLRLKVLPWLAVGAGVPFSFGPQYMWDSGSLCIQSTSTAPECGFHVQRQWNMAFFSHLEPNIEIRVPWGGALRIYGGRTDLLNAANGTCTATLPGGCPSHGGEVTYYGGFAIGYAF